MPDEIVTRRHLPHWYVPHASHFVTYRLAGTIPATAMNEMRLRRIAELAQGPPEGIPAADFRERVHKKFFGEYDRWLDEDKNIQWLKDPRVAAIIRENLYHHHGGKYLLLAYCVMPNHVYVLLHPVVAANAVEQAGSLSHVGQAASLSHELHSDEIADGKSPLAAITHSLKSYTANRANKVLGRKGQFWQQESYDHWVRDADELARIVEYIAWNPVKAGLSTTPWDWPFCSAFDRFRADGERTGWLAPNLPLPPL